MDNNNPINSSIIDYISSLVDSNKQLKESNEQLKKEIDSQSSTLKKYIDDKLPTLAKVNGSFSASNFIINGIDIRDYLIGCTLYDMAYIKNTRSLPFNFTVGEYDLTKSGSGNDAFDTIEVKKG